MLARCSSAALQGFEAIPVLIEVDICPGLPGLHLVGLADTATQEARERVRSAMRNSGFRVPLTRVVVNLAPADRPKQGPGFDLPLALGLLLATGQLDPKRLQGVWSAGELGLDGGLRPIRGILAIALAARQAGARGLLVPQANAAEASLVEGLAVFSGERLDQLVGCLAGAAPWPMAAPDGAPEPAPAADPPPPDLAEVQGQALGRRALELAAAGGHHLLLVGPPGSGKTMLARRLPGLLPPLSRQEALELTQLHSVAGVLPQGSGLLRRRPFRYPHHGCSAAALLAGGGLPRPGELCLAHQGVLFLDELAEFRRDVLDQLRQPLEEGELWISRSRQSCRFPCRTTLIAATNPCPCGWFGDPERSCRCGERLRQRYWGRLAGPLLDRIDLQVLVRRLPPEQLSAAYRCATPEPSLASGEAQPESSARVAERVDRARRRMHRRNPGGCSNAQLAAGALRQRLSLSDEARELWQTAMTTRRLSARSGERLLRVALTLADLEGVDQPGRAQIAEALTLRCLDQGSWPGASEGPPQAPRHPSGGQPGRQARRGSPLSGGAECVR